MSGDIETKPSILFWIIAGLFILWGLMGCGIYLADKFMTDANLLEARGQEALDARHAYPIWASAAYGIAVWVGLLAAILMILRKKLSIALFVVSLIAAVICFIPTFIDPIFKEAGGAYYWVMPLIVVTIGIFEIIFSRKQGANGILR